MKTLDSIIYLVSGMIIGINIYKAGRDNNLHSFFGWTLCLLWFTNAFILTLTKYKMH